MPRTRECDYCGGDIEPGTGTMFVHTDGTTVHYCSAKCEKNADLGREPRSREWTAAGQAEGGAVVTQVEPEPEAEAAAGDEAGEPEAEAPDLEAAEGSTEPEEEAAAEEAEPAATEDETDEEAAAEAADEDEEEEDTEE